MQTQIDNNTNNGSHQRSEFTSHLLLSDNEILELGIRSCDVELYRRKHYQAKFGIDTWYDSLSQHTFRTSGVPLQYNTGDAITQKFYSKSLTEIQEKLLKDLETSIDAVAQKDFPNGFFIKLNTRSPKDVPVYAFENPKIQQLVIEEIEKLDKRDRNENNEVIAFIKATNKSMKLHTGKEAVQLLTSSTRICEDLNKVLQFPPHLFDCKVILREWLDEVAEHPEGEFRCFVHKNSLNAITQYFNFSYFDDLAKNKDKVQNQIVTFFDSVKDKLQSHSSYVVDFFVLPDRVLIIELNPFHSGAGSGLFSWKDNRELFMYGPLEMRVVEKPMDTKEVIPAFWQRFIDSRFHPNKLSEDDEEEEEERMIPKFWPWTVVAVMLVGVFVYKKYISK